MAPATDIALTLRTDPRLLCAARGLVRGYLDKYGIAAERIETAVLAVDEAITNAMRHAYHGATDASVSLTLHCAQDWLEIVVQDEGQPAPAERVERKNVESPDPARLQPGGLGVQLIYSAFDEARFEPGAGRGNRVVMRLRAGGAEECR